MSLWRRITNVFRSDRLSREIQEELESHVQEGIEQGRDPDEARRAFGSILRQGEASRDVRIVAWVDSLRADTLFGWRQLNKKKVTSVAAILSLGLATGACISAFRLIDALLLRPLPIAAPERLNDLFRQQIDVNGNPGTFDGWAYPVFRQMRAAVKEDAELIAVSYADRTDLTYKSDQEMERAYLQYVSGWMFGSFGIRPALGRLLTERDDLEPAAHPYAVLSYDYWARRFGRDPKVIGRAFQVAGRAYEIVGVAGEGFTGTEPGTIIDVFLPTMMQPYVTRPDSTWHRTLVLLKPGASAESLRARLDAISIAFERDRAKRFTNESPLSIERYLRQTVRLEPAASGVSDMQNSNRRSLMALGALVVMVLLIACANVANLMTAQAAARAREMALRVSIGAARWRLMQLVLLESAVLASFAAVAGGVFAWWSAPLVVTMINPQDEPARLFLPVDWRVLLFGLALTVGVMLLFGLGPALRASAIKPASALKGDDNPHSRRRTMHALIALQVAFCFTVLFVAGLFVATFNRLSHQSNGFAAERILTLDTVATHTQPAAVWNQVAEQLRSLPGVEMVALASRPLLGGNSSNGSISVHGGPPSDDLAYFMGVSPGWLSAMKIPLTSGNDLRMGDSHPGVAVVSETFAKRYFGSVDAVGKSFEAGDKIAIQIVGVVRDARYRSVRDAIPPVAYFPFAGGDRATFVVRSSSGNPLALASALRKEVPHARSEFRVSNISTQQEINDSHTVRERLTAALAIFFAGVALLLAGVGLFGVLDYSVLQRRREIGIRMAIGAQAADVAWRVTSDALGMVMLGALVGLGFGAACAHYVEALFYQVKPTDLPLLVLPALTIFIAALLAALPAVIRAVRIDPVAILRLD